MSAVEVTLRDAAFGGTGPVSERLFAVRGAGARARLLAAVVLGARGRYAAAAALLEASIRQDEPVVASLAASTLASHRRQLGGHAAALPLDGRALNLAVGALRGGAGIAPSGWVADVDGLDVDGALADALLGLAADNLGLGRLRAAEALVTRAARVAAASGCWRTRVRLEWVRTELALASGDGTDSVLPAKVAKGLAESQGAVRHGAKSALMLGAALMAAGMAGPEEVENKRQATAVVAEAFATAQRHGWRSLTWPAQLLLAELDQDNWNKSRVTDELMELLKSTDPVGRRLARSSPWVPI